MRRLSALALLLTVTTFAVHLALSQTAPVMTIAPLGTNQFLITVTNGVSTTNYTLYWTPILADPNYPWQYLGTGTTGQTNFTVDGGGLQTGFYRSLIGGNPNVGVLDLTIDYPTNGTVFN